MESSPTVHKHNGKQNMGTQVTIHPATTDPKIQTRIASMGSKVSVNMFTVLSFDLTTRQVAFPQREGGSEGLTVTVTSLIAM